MKKKIAIIGAGQIASNIIQGLLLAGYTQDHITVIGRKKTDFSRVEKFGILTSRNYEDVFKSEIIILAIKPEESSIKHVFSWFAELRGHHYFNLTDKAYDGRYIFVSVVSGLGLGIINEFSYFRKNVVTVMLNTNIAQHTGVITLAATNNHSLTQIQALFSPLGQIEVVKAKKLQYLTTYVGSGNALHAKGFWLISQTEGASFSNVLHEVVSVETIESFNSSNLSLLKKYVENMRFFYKKKFENIGEQLLLQTLQSTAQTLLKRKLLNQSGVDLFMQEVATPGGCTQKGIGLMTIESLQTIEGLKEIIQPISVGALSFKKQIKAGLLGVKVLHTGRPWEKFPKSSYMFK